MVAPEYLHLSGAAVPITFFGGIALFLALIVAAIIVALRGEKKAIEEASVTPGEIGYNIALAAIIASFLAAFKRAPKAAWIACIVALLGLGVDYWTGPPRAFIWNRPNLFGLKGQPLGWSQLFINNTIISPTGKPMNITDLDMMGANLSDKEIKLDDIYFISGMDGERLNVKIGLGGTRYKIEDINPIPPKAIFFISSDPIGPPNTGFPQQEFLNKWGAMTLVVKFDGTEQRIAFDKDTVIASLPRPAEPFPHVSPKVQH